MNLENPWFQMKYKQNVDKCHSPPPPHTHKWLRYSILVCMTKQTWWDPNQSSPQRTRCYTDALTAILRCPWPPSDRFIVCLERTCSVFTTALGAELEWRHVTRVRTPATCVTLVNLSAPTLVITNPCALTRVGGTLILDPTVLFWIQ